MTHRRRHRSTIGVLLVALLVLAACGEGKDDDPGRPGAVGDPVRGGSLTYGIEAETGDGWCLQESQLAISGIVVARAIYDTLTVPNAEGEYAADWTWLLRLSLLGNLVRVPETLCRKYFQKTSISQNWASSRAQRRALRQAAVREVWQSSLDLPRRAILAAYIGLNLPRLGVVLRRALRLNRP